MIQVGLDVILALCWKGIREQCLAEVHDPVGVHCLSPLKSPSMTSSGSEHPRDRAAAPSDKRNQDERHS